MFDKHFFRGWWDKVMTARALAAVLAGLLAAPAQAAGQRRGHHARDLVLAPAGSELLLLPQTRPAVRVLNLTRTIPDTVDAQDYLGEVWSEVEDTLAEGGRVFAQGLRGPMPARLNAAWDQIGARHQVSPARLRALLDHEFDLRPAPWLGADVDELLPRSRGAPAEAPPERPRPAR
jgi:hypothetical protein